MQWTDDAILLSVGRIADKALLLEVLTERHGRVRAIAPLDQDRLAALLPGSFLNLNYQLRELNKPGRAEVLKVDGGVLAETADDAGLIVLTGVQAVLSRLIPENEPVPKVYAALHRLVMSLVVEDGRWALNYALWEFSIAQALRLISGVAQCQADFRHGETIYFAPKSRRAVTRTQAGAFLDRMMPLPGILMGARNGKVVDVAQALDLTGELLSESLSDPDNATCLAQRQRILEEVGELKTIGPWRPESVNQASLEERRNRLLSMRKLVVSTRRS